MAIRLQHARFRHASAERVAPPGAKAAQRVLHDLIAASDVAQLSLELRLARRVRRDRALERMPLER